MSPVYTVYSLTTIADSSCIYNMLNINGLEKKKKNDIMCKQKIILVHHTGELSTNRQF